MRPADGFVTVAIICMSVVFPAPLGPRRPRTPPFTLSERSRTPYLPEEKRLDTDSRWSMRGYTRGGRVRFPGGITGVMPSVARDLGERGREARSSSHLTPRSLATLGMTAILRSFADNARSSSHHPPQRDYFFLMESLVLDGSPKIRVAGGGSVASAARRFFEIGRRVYTCVERIEAWPRISCTSRMSVPLLTSIAAIVCRSECGVMCRLISAIRTCFLKMFSIE